MNRLDEFLDLKKELANTVPPFELEYSLSRGVAKANQYKRRSLLWKAPVVSFGTVLLAFVLLVNLFPAVAQAMCNFPFLEPLVRAVSLDPSMRKAVENDYIQAVGASQTKGDITVTVDYMIIDAGRISIFFKVDSPKQMSTQLVEAFKADGTGFVACISYNNMYDEGVLQEVRIDLAEGEKVPEVFTLKLKLAEENGNINNSNTTDGNSNVFEFQLYPEAKYTNIVNTVIIDQWIDVMDQRIYLDRLDIYPTQAKLTLHADDNNSAVLRGIDIYFEDSKGERYGSKTNGWTASHDAETNSLIIMLFESSYFTKTQSLKLCIEGISIIEKDKLYGIIDYAHKTISNLPEGVSIEKMNLSGSLLELSFKVKYDILNCATQIANSTYYDFGGNEYTIDLWSSDVSLYPEDTYFNTNFSIKDYEDNKYKLVWVYSLAQQLDVPIEIELNLN
ncbi:MAG: hypothetical protein K0S01_1589 [Herbinix sp.]|jgi:hypothetical protein|nr:hypothetical protein [Herbinix sp.]